MRPPVWLAPDWLSERAASSARAVKSQDVVICRSILGQHRPLEKPAGNGSHRDFLYVEELIGPETVNTMPEETIRAFQDQGKVAHTLEQDLDKARQLLADLERVGLRRRRLNARPRRRREVLRVVVRLLETIGRKRTELAAA